MSMFRGTVMFGPVFPGGLLLLLMVVPPWPFAALDQPVGSVEPENSSLAEGASATSPFTAFVTEALDNVPALKSATVVSTKVGWVVVNVPVAGGVGEVDAFPTPSDEATR